MLYITPAPSGPICGRQAWPGPIARLHSLPPGEFWGESLALLTLESHVTQWCVLTESRWGPFSLPIPTHRKRKLKPLWKSTQ